MKTYQEVIDYLYSQLPMFQRKGASAYKDNLDNTLRLDEMYKHPHTNFKTIHVGGTNGKGSVSHMISSVLQQSGYKVGLYTSPHLKSFRERIRVNEKMVSEDFIIRFVNQFVEMNKEALLAPSFFEITVAMAFKYFEEKNVDVAVVEVGLGGRLDSTNIIQPELSVITNISLDHTALLGNTIEQIAFEKAGIIKENTPIVIGEHHQESDPVFSEKSHSVNAYLTYAQDLVRAEVIEKNEMSQYLKIESTSWPSFMVNLDLMGEYQKNNIVTALTVIETLSKQNWNISLDSIQQGLASVVKNTGLLGRWQLLSRNPKTICDTGHNEAGIRFIVKQLDETTYNQLYFVLGMVNDKDHHKVMSMLPKQAKYYFCQASIPRAMDAYELKSMAKTFGLDGEVIPNVQEALSKAKSEATIDDLVFVGGSTFTVAEVV